MDFNTIMQLIGSYGFPIVACCALAWYFNKINENYRNDLKELNANHKEEVKAMTEAIANNTLAKFKEKSKFPITLTQAIK